MTELPDRRNQVQRSQYHNNLPRDKSGMLMSDHLVKESEVRPENTHRQVSHGGKRLSSGDHSPSHALAGLAPAASKRWQYGGQIIH